MAENAIRQKLAYVSMAGSAIWWTAVLPPKSVNCISPKFSRWARQRSVPSKSKIENRLPRAKSQYAQGGCSSLCGSLNHRKKCVFWGKMHFFSLFFAVFCIFLVENLRSPPLILYFCSVKSKTTY